MEQMGRKEEQDDMKKFRKFAAGLFVLFAMMVTITLKTYAADGVIFFTDLDTNVGEKFTITGTVKSYGEDLSDITLHMSYDPEYIRFMDGESATDDGEGSLVFQGPASNDRIDFELEFQALQEGDMRINLDEAEVKTVSGSSLECELGYSDITIGEGDPSKIEEPAKKGPSVTVGSIEYTLSEAFNDPEVPRGFTSGTITYSGVQYQGAVQESGEMRLGYLMDTNGIGSFFVLNETEGVFEPFEQVLISENGYIILLQDDGNVKLPSSYEEVNLTVNDHQFPAWQDTQNKDFYLVYALNAEGVKGMYRYDSKEDTYQRYDVEEAQEEGESKKAGLFGKVSDYLGNHVDQFLLGFLLVIFLFFVLLIILAVKLHNRNAELDEIYDEYGLDLEDGKAEIPSKGSSEPESLFDEDEDFDLIEEDLEDEVEEADLEDEEDYYDDEDDADDFDEYENLDFDQTANLKQKPNKISDRKKSKKDDDFDIEFIDLD